MPPSDFRIIRKQDLPLAARGPWRTRPIVRLAKGQLYFSHRANIFARCRLVLVEFQETSGTLKFTGIPDPLPNGLVEDDLFRVTKQGRQGEKSGCSVAVKSLLAHLHFPPNGAPRELEIVSMDSEARSICVILGSSEDSHIEAENVDSPVEVHRGFNGR
jgi:hypothetical protein